MKRSRMGRINWGGILISTFVVAIAALILIFSFGSVTGEEFSPQKFRIREFSYYQIPIIRLQVWPVHFQKTTAATTTLAEHVRTNKLQGEVNGEPTEWHIVSMRETGRQAFVGDASILTNYLKQPGAPNTLNWLEWSIKHDEQAELLWGTVAKLAHERMYVLIPDILELARRETGADFETKLKAFLAAELRKFSDAESERGDTKQSQHLANLATEFETDS